MAMDDHDEGSNDLVTTLTDALEELLVTVIEGVRERPVVAMALVAGVIAGLVGIALAGVGRPKRRVPRAGFDLQGLFEAMTNALEVEQRSKRVSREFGRAGDRLDGKSRGLFSAMSDLRSAGDLVPVAIRLLENPLVRSYLRHTVTRQVRQRFS